MFAMQPATTHASKFTTTTSTDSTEPSPTSTPLPPIWESPDYYERTRQTGRRNPRLAPRCDNCNRWIQGACFPDGRLPPPVPDNERLFCNIECGYSYMWKGEEEERLMWGQRGYLAGLANMDDRKNLKLKRVKMDEKSRKRYGGAVELDGCYVGSWEDPEEEKARLRRERKRQLKRQSAEAS